MKRCPTCDKTFADGMKFCQTDGTVLIDDAPPVDPYKTVVGNQSDIASAIPPLDPFKTMVASPPPKVEDDLLQLPEEPDAMKTMIIPHEQVKKESKAEIDAPLDLPPMPIAPSAPLIEPEKKSDAPKVADSGNSPFNPFNSEESEKSAGLSDATAIMDSDFSKEIPASPFDSKPFQNDFSGQSPYGNTDNLPIPSPFQDSMPPGAFQPPASPFEESKPPVSNYEPAYQEPPSASNESPFGQASSNPFGASEWTPPPAPVAGWQNQGLGAETPFQPPVAAGGLNQTLPIISLVLGILSVCCYIAPVTGIAALIIGYLGMKNINQDPNQYGGKGLAIAGMIVGGIFFLIGIFYWIYIIFIIGLAASGGFR